MNRAPELRMLSEDHHHGLVHACRLKKAALGDPEHPARATARAFLDFWREETSIHFRKEEEVLLPVMTRHGADITREPLVQMLIQHAEIRGLVMRLGDEIIAGYVSPEIPQELGKRLEEHIHLEERVVFPLVEESLSGPALAELAVRLDDRE